MNPIQRSLSGLALAVLVVPAFLGILACIPTMPMIGDPEKARIDPEITGVWVELEASAVAYFEPYDKRSWLVSYTGIENTCPDSGDDDANFANYEDLIAAASGESACIAFHVETIIFKAWTKKIRDRWFMTWEQKGVPPIGADASPYVWWSFLLERPDENQLILAFIDWDHQKFEAQKALVELGDADPPFDPRLLQRARKAAERVIRRNIGDDELYLQDERLEFRRVEPEHQELFEDAFTESTLL